jgi:hypothetical protein
MVVPRAIRQSAGKNQPLYHRPIFVEFKIWVVQPAHSHMRSKILCYYNLIATFPLVVGQA